MSRSTDSSFDPKLWAGDLAIANARVITMDRSRPEAEATLIQNGRISAVGDSEEILTMVAGATEIVDWQAIACSNWPSLQPFSAAESCTRTKSTQTKPTRKVRCVF
ncbi:hypothetical protein [Arthrobacter sp. S2(2024)]|uniref:hypothetical protein n=1 Tax=Arthrobacter sp. S2(2024) TaxID=3111911 RepID=UPI002FC992CC